MVIVNITNQVITKPFTALRALKVWLDICSKVTRNGYQKKKTGICRLGVPPRSNVAKEGAMLSDPYRYRRQTIGHSSTLNI